MAKRKYSDGPMASTDRGNIEPSLEFEFDVFLNFRGPDTRLNFVDCLYHFMDGAGIRVFKDDEELRKGEVIGNELEHVIKNSRICMPIFSRDYASSVWCLRELAHMVDCKAVILPIFFNVDPYDVKLKTKLYHVALQRHEQRFGREVVQRWKEALEMVARMKGWDLKDRGQGELIRAIVAEVVNKLNIRDKSLPGPLIGIEDRVEDIMHMLNEGFPDVRYLVIHGMGGIGKTTLAKVIFNRISSQFHGCSFLFDVWEASKCGNIVQLQKQLLSEILNSKPVEIFNSDAGVHQIKRRFRNKKILMVLDDLDEWDQLSQFAEKHDWFGLGSRIIITTRDTNFLPIKGENRDNDVPTHLAEFQIYQMRELGHHHAFQLFCQHAFQMDSPPRDYDNIACDIILKADGLPLALKVIGSSLFGQSKRLWKDSLKKLNLVPNHQVLDKLRINFEMLDDAQKEIFLDIACYFIGEERIHPHYMWKALEFFPRSNIIVLVRMSLIKIDENDKLLMHDLLKDLGREIVRQENLKIHGKRSRLWSPHVALDIVLARKGTENIVALKLSGLSKEHDFTSEQFSWLPSLRLLELEGGNLVGDFKNLLSSLRWLSWRRCPSYLQAVNLCLWKLVVLKLLDSDIPENWNGWGPCLANRDLTAVHLKRCHLSTTPDFSTCSNLKILVFDEQGPKSLQIGSSICKLKRLKRLEIIGAQVQPSKLFTSLQFNNLFTLPSAICSLKYLSSLKLEGQRIQELHPSIGEMAGLKCLSLKYCDELRTLPDFIGKLRSLLELDLFDTRIRKLPDSIGELKKLEKMNLGFTQIRKLPNSIGGLESLLNLDLRHTKITELPASIGYLERLERLCLANSQVRGLPKAMGMLKNLKLLGSGGCRSTRWMRDSQKLKGWNLSIDIPWPPQLGVLTIPCSDPRSLTRLPSSLRRLELRYVKSPIEQPFFSNLRCLSKLTLFRCWLREIEFEQLENLHHLIMDKCDSLVRLLGLSSLGKLKQLEVSSCSQLIEIQDLGELPSLKGLSIEYCNSIEKLPDLSELHNLQTLHLCHCESLRGLPDVPNPCHSYVHGCRMLDESADADEYRTCFKCSVNNMHSCNCH